MWCGGRADQTLARVARYGDGWLGAFVTADRYAERWSRLTEMVTEAGRAIDEVAAGLHVYIRVDDDADRAWRDAGAFISEVYAVDAAPMRRYCIVGGAEQCAAEIRTFLQAGASDVIFRIAGTDLEDQMHRLTQVVSCVEEPARTFKESEVNA